MKIQENKSILKSGLCLLAGLILWFIPAPAGLEPEAWHLLAVFISVIFGFLVNPMPMGPIVLIGIVVLAATKALPLKTATAGYGDTTVWLVVSAFLISGAVIKSGLGKRLAFSLVRLLGRSTLGLGYAICAAELMLGPVVPSNTARGGGILAPVVQAIAQAIGSEPKTSPQKGGSFLTLVGAHANLITAAMFLTGMAANPLVSKAASDVLGIEFGWTTWALGAIVPGLAGLLLLPLLMYKLDRPQVAQAGAARQEAQKELLKMGPITRSEIIVAITFAGLLILWISKPLHGMSTTTVALAGVCSLLLTGALTWKDAVGNQGAWDTLVWLGGLLGMANGLKEAGVIGWFENSFGSFASDAGIGGMALLLLLALVYFFSMYGFSMLTAHISALVAAFFALALAGGAPEMLTVAVLAYFSNLSGCLTNYSTGPVIIYFGLGYVDSAKWFSHGIIIAAFHLTIWLGLGLSWWKLLGWW